MPATCPFNILQYQNLWSTTLFGRLGVATIVFGYWGCKLQFPCILGRNFPNHYCTIMPLEICISVNKVGKLTQP